MTEKELLKFNEKFSQFYNELNSIYLDGPISGVYFWEYVHMPDDFIDKINSIFHPNYNYNNCNIL